MSKTPDPEYAASLAQYEELVATIPGVERKGKTLPYTSMNGHMFSFLAKDGHLALRLPAGEREAFLAKHNTELSVQHGAVMKEYVVVPASLLANTQELQPYFSTSFEYVSSLKPKPTKRKKAKA